MNIAIASPVAATQPPSDRQGFAGHRLDQRHRARHRPRACRAGSAIVLNGFGKPDEIAAIQQSASPTNST